MMTRVHPAARGRALAARAADDSVHAREPRDASARAGARRRGDRGQPTDRRRPARRARRSCATRASSHPQPGRRRRAARPMTRASRRRSTAVRALSRQARAEQGHHAPVDVVDRAELDWPLVIARRRPRRADAGARGAARDATSGSSAGSIRRRRRGWLAHASMLIFPSRGPESLSRVLIEASALGVPIAAMDTGGTRDIVEHDGDGPALDDTRGAGRRCAAVCETIAALRATAWRRRASSAAEREFDAAIGGRAIERSTRTCWRSDEGRAWSPARSFRCTATAASSARLRSRPRARRRDVDVTLDHA